MYELLAIAYDTLPDAEAARSELLALSSRYLVDVADALVATSDAPRHIKLERLVDMWPEQLSGRPIWGTLAGILCRHPRVGQWAETAGALDEYGIQDSFIESVLTVLASRGAVLFVLARQANSGHVLECLHQTGGQVLRSDLHRPAALAAQDPAGLGIRPFMRVAQRA